MAELADEAHDAVKESWKNRGKEKVARRARSPPKPIRSRFGPKGGPVGSGEEESDDGSTMTTYTGQMHRQQSKAAAAAAHRFGLVTPGPDRAAAVARRGKMKKRKKATQMMKIKKSELS